MTSCYLSVLRKSRKDQINVLRLFVGAGSCRRRRPPVHQAVMNASTIQSVAGEITVVLGSTEITARTSLPFAHLSHRLSPILDHSITLSNSTDILARER